MKAFGFIATACALWTISVCAQAQLCRTFDGVQRPEFVEPSSPDYIMEDHAVDKSLSVVALEKNPVLPETGSVAITPGIRRKDDGMRTVRFRFYGKQYVVSVSDEAGSFHPSGISEKEVDSFMEQLDELDWEMVADRCMALKTEQHFNDWAMFEWIQTLSAEVFPKNINSERSILTVFLMDKLGLMTRLVRSDDKLISLYSSKQQVYSRQFVVIDGYPLYAPDSFKLSSEVYAYRSKCEGKSRPLDMRISLPVSFEDSAHNITCSHSSAVFNKSISFPIDSELLSFYNSYPQLDPFVYACSAPSRDFEKALTTGIKESLHGISGVDAVNLMLDFVQKDFEYKLDVEQFGREKPFFCEENFVYSYNDCEDRCILFSYLVRSVLGMKVLLVDYGEHLATAVSLPDDIKGTFVRYNKTKYYLCDPSYIGSKAGMSIPRYDSLPVKLYVL